MLIGEAATHVPDHVRKLAADIPWRQIVGLRNRLVHAYRLIDDDALWTIIRQDVPALLSPLRALLASIPPP